MKVNLQGWNIRVHEGWLGGAREGVKGEAVGSVCCRGVVEAMDEMLLVERVDGMLLGEAVNGMLFEISELWRRINCEEDYIKEKDAEGVRRQKKGRLH